MNFSQHDTFWRWGVVSTSLNPQAGWPPLVGCQRLLIQYIRSYLPYGRLFLPSENWRRAMPWWQGPPPHMGTSSLLGRIPLRWSRYVQRLADLLLAYCFRTRNARLHNTFCSPGAKRVRERDNRERDNTESGIPLVLDKAVCALLTDAILPGTNTSVKPAVPDTSQSLQYCCKFTVQHITWY